MTPRDTRVTLHVMSTIVYNNTLVNHQLVPITWYISDNKSSTIKNDDSLFSAGSKFLYCVFIKSHTMIKTVKFLCKIVYNKTIDTWHLVTNFYYPLFQDSQNIPTKLLDNLISITERTFSALVGKVFFLLKTKVLLKSPISSFYLALVLLFWFKVNPAIIGILKICYDGVKTFHNCFVVGSGAIKAITAINRPWT